MSWLTWAIAATGLVLTPFGPVSQLIQDKEPWEGFSSSGTLLLNVRIQQVDSQNCQDWIQSLSSETDGVNIASVQDSASWKKAWLAWEPWSEKDQKGIQQCTQAPCDVKINPKEGQELSKVVKEGRFDKFLELVKSRVLYYVRTSEKKAYEFPDPLTDPWSYFEKAGFIGSLPRPLSSSLWVRKLDLGSGSIRPIRQVVDRRFAQSKEGLEGNLWLRDVYTDHYFESWGEWTHISCQGTKKKVLVIQALIVDFDLLKKKDLISVLSRGKMTSAVESQGKRYLNHSFERLRQSVNKLTTSF